MTLSLLMLLAVFFLAGYNIGRGPRKRILKPIDDNRPFTSEELKQIGIILPDPVRYDCETFVR